MATGATAVSNAAKISKAVKKARPAGAVNGTKKKAKSKTPGPPRYATYVQKAFKDIKENRAKGKYKNLTISANSLNALDLLIDHVLDSFIYNAEKTCSYAQTAKTSKNPKSNCTLQTKHVKAAMEAALSGRLAKQATDYAEKAVSQYVESTDPEDAAVAAAPAATPVEAD